MKRLVCVILSIVLVVGVFTACSKSDDSNTADLENVNFTVDYHYDDIDESSRRAYEKLCNAVIAGDSEVKFNTSMKNDVYQLFYTSFPLYALVDSLEILDDSTGVSITYTNDAEEHIAKVNQFLNKIEEIKTECGYGEVSIDRYIFNVYTYLTKNIQYDSSVITTFDTAIEGKGYSASICSLFEYLVLQGGGKASHIVGSAQIISYVEYQGQWYYFNPSLDIQKNQGSALTGFAMDSSRTGVSDYKFTNDDQVEEVTDNTFDKLKNSVSYEDNDDSVTVACGNESLVLNFN
jgi:hypothetical protein